ncbi:MAG: hypothetical protein AAGC65_07515 [Mucilaginibacter sp.]|uniref:hypothetical protein n=1 Tax=Mucilaginibacter sp. TaxID=1882438 RepID=UPI0031B02D8E
MWVLQFLFIATILSIINCFQFAAGILAKQTGHSFWRWYWISQFLPIISMIILIALWKKDEQPKITETHH